MHALAINSGYLCLVPHHHYSGYDISHTDQYRRQHLVCGCVSAFREILIDNKRSGNRPVHIDNHISGNAIYSRVPFSATRSNIPRNCTRHCSNWDRAWTFVHFIFRLWVSAVRCIDGIIRWILQSNVSPTHSLGSLGAACIQYEVV